MSRRRVDDHRRRKTDTWWRRHDWLVMWVGFVVIAIVLLQGYHDLRTTQHRLDARQNYLCVQILKGRIVFKQVLDALGNPVATKVTLVDCPANPKPKP